MIFKPLQLADFLKGKSALFFTNCEKSEVTEWFDNYSFEDFADPETKVDHTITLPKGPMFQVEPHLGTYLKHLGLPITFEEGDLKSNKEKTILNL
jgi:ribosomal protein L10